MLESTHVGLTIQATHRLRMDSIITLSGCLRTFSALTPLPYMVRNQPGIAVTCFIGSTKLLYARPG